MCRCCSFESLSCRRRTLKTAGSFLFIFGLVFFLAGVAVGILPRVYNELPDVYSLYIFYAYLVPATGMTAVVTGMGAIHMGRVMSDDDCSARGVSILALLTIVCSLASVGVPAWPLYEDGYFLEIPPMSQTMDNETTTSLLTTLPPMMSTNALDDGNFTTMANTNMTGMLGNDTITSSSNTSTMGPVVTTVAATTMNPPTTADTVSLAENSTQMNSTQTDAMSTPAPDNATVDTNATAPSTSDSVTYTANSTDAPMMTTNSTELTTDVPREPIPYDQWFDVIVPFGIICFFALIFVLCAMLVCCIGCCCADYSEIVDDSDIYKT